MTRDQQIKAALEILKLPLTQREAARVSIEKALAVMGSASTIHGIVKRNRSRAVTEARDAYYRALCKLRVTHKALLDTGSGMVGVLDLAAIENTIAAFEQSDTPVRYEVYPDFAGRWRQGFAVAAAYELLMQWWGSDEFIKTTRKRPWWRLSAILYGDPEADLFAICVRSGPNKNPFFEQTRTIQK